jgi:xanthine phosphoribosyltransferase
MDLLKRKIREEGIVLQGRILKIDSFLNHQIDPNLMMEIGQAFAARFAETRPTKVLTIESSGIAPALMTAFVLNVPLIFARKQPSVTIRSEETLETQVYSYTKEQTYHVTVASKLLGPSDKVLIIDDFLANGEAALGLARLAEQAEAEVVGIGAVVEKAFQPGGQMLQDAGYNLNSLVRIASLQGNQVQFVGEAVHV